MSTWDDKPNDYGHAVRLLDAAYAEIDRLRAALEEIVRNGDQGVHVPGPYEIAKAALAKEGSGYPYIKENDELRAEIARLQRCIAQIEEDEIARLQELLHGT